MIPVQRTILINVRRTIQITALITLMITALITLTVLVPAQLSYLSRPAHLYSGYPNPTVTPPPPPPPPPSRPLANTPAWLSLVLSLPPSPANSHPRQAHPAPPPPLSPLHSLRHCVFLPLTVMPRYF